jgi:hypothetical protein
MKSDRDHYEAYYAEKLWALLPAVYRGADAVDLEDRGPLRELVERIGVQAAVLRRSIDRLWEDQSIETCDDWVIPYIADLLATNVVSALDARGKRVDVAKTIHYRRRKGTVAVLEEIARDVTGWDARVVEFFRRLARTRHGLDPALGWPLETRNSLAVAQGLLGRRTRTPAGGLLDVRDTYGASRAAFTAFDEGAHTVDVRHGRGRAGWYGISRLGVFVWRLKSVLVSGVDPVPYTNCPRKLTFDPTGRELPLFAVSAGRYGDEWVSPEEHELCAPISRALLATSLEALYARADETDPDVLDWRALAVFDGELSSDALVTAADFTGDLRDLDAPDAGKHGIDPEAGALYLAEGSALDPRALLVAYAGGFSSSIGAGAYDRSLLGGQPISALPLQPTVTGGTPGAIGPSGTLEIGDSRTYDGMPDVAVEPGGMLVLRAGGRCRPCLRFEPLNETARAWTFTGGLASNRRSSLWLDGLLVSGASLVLDGDFETVTLSACTLDPGALDGEGKKLATSADGRKLVPSRLQVKGHVQRLVVDRSISGPIELAGKGTIATLVIADSIVQNVHGARAIDIDTGKVEISRATVLGTGRVHQLEAQNSILHDQFDVIDHQHGCVRFSAWAAGGSLP